MVNTYGSPTTATVITGWSVFCFLALPVVSFLSFPLLLPLSKAKFKKMGMDLNEEAFEAMASQVRQQIDRESTALFGTARLWDDGIIDPRKSRDVLIDALSICHATADTPLSANTYGVARM